MLLKIALSLIFTTCHLIFFNSIAHAQTLHHLIDLSLKTHPSIQTQEALVASAANELEGAKWQFYPTPSITIERIGSGSMDRLYMGNSTVVTARIQQPLWTAGRLTAGLEKSQANFEYSLANLEEVRLQLSLRIIQIYGDWLAANLKLLAYEKSYHSHLRLQEQVRRRVNEGSSSLSDLTLAQSRLASVVADMALSRATREASIAKLGQIVGHKLDSHSMSTSVSLPRSNFTDIEALLEKAILNSPSIAKAKAQATIQEATIRERRADLSPELYARLERQYGNFSYLSAAPETRVFIGLSTRLGAGLSTQSNIAAAVNQYESARAEIQNQTTAISETVIADFMMAASSVERYQAISTTLEAIQNVADSHSRQFLSGKKTWIDVMNSSREIAQTEIQLAELTSTQTVLAWRLAAYSNGVKSLAQVVD
jgi:adhesin transport system outer membrane protein